MAPITVTPHCRDVVNTLKKPSALGAIEIWFVLAETDTQQCVVMFFPCDSAPTVYCITIIHAPTYTYTESELPARFLLALESPLTPVWWNLLQWKLRCCILKRAAALSSIPHSSCLLPTMPTPYQHFQATMSTRLHTACIGESIGTSLVEFAPVEAEMLHFEKSSSIFQSCHTHCLLPSTASPHQHLFLLPTIRLFAAHIGVSIDTSLINFAPVEAEMLHFEWRPTSRDMIDWPSWVRQCATERSCAFSANSTSWQLASRKGQASFWCAWTHEHQLWEAPQMQQSWQSANAGEHQGSPLIYYGCLCTGSWHHYG